MVPKSLVKSNSLSLNTSMAVMRCVLLLFVYFVSGISGETVDFFTLCGSSGSSGYDRSIYDSDKLTVSMEGYNWPASSTSCTVVFKASDNLDDLYVSFNTFAVTDTGIEIELRSKYSFYYSLEDTYGFLSSPSIGYEKETNTYLKVTVTRDFVSLQGLSAEFEVFTDDYKTNRDSKLDDEDYGSVGTTIAIIVGSVAGGIALIIIIVVVIVCVVCNSTARRNRGVVMATGNPHVATTSSGIPMYPYQAPPGNYAMHPSAQPMGYPVQPGAYPPTQTMSYPGAPPTYNDVANGNTNPPSGKVEPTAPQ